MATPGEVPQQIGRAYVLALGGCLEATVAGFRRTFDVYNNPDKLSFDMPAGGSFSFDVGGLFEPKAWVPREVFIECKGHRDGAAVLDGYREFLGNAFVVSATIKRHSGDMFWFVTNVPFGSSIGRRLIDYDIVVDILRRHKYAGDILAASSDERPVVERFLSAITVCIFPDSFIRLIGVNYLVQQDDNLWTILQHLHGGVVPVDMYEPVSQDVARRNSLPSPDVLIPGTTLSLPWFGISWPADVDGSAQES